MQLQYTHNNFSRRLLRIYNIFNINGYNSNIGKVVFEVEMIKNYLRSVLSQERLTG